VRRLAARDVKVTMPAPSFLHFFRGRDCADPAVSESSEALIRRLDEASRFVPLERLGISPQCGFASTIGGNPATENDERRKLRRVVEVAEQIWGSA
jgi:methionine synthase II (cobalamin-independent)